MKKLLLAATALIALGLGANAADLPMRSAPAPIIAAVPIFTWTGFYVGVNAGYGWNSNSNNNSYYDPLLSNYGGGGGDDGGFVGGGQVGYNYQINQFVIGVETDIQYADIGSNGGYFGSVYGNNDSGNWFGTLRVRAGFAFDRALIYATGGFAYGDVGNRNSFVSPLVQNYYYDNGNSTNTGWTLGAGFEYAFTNNLTARIEGLYVSLDSDSNNSVYAGAYNRSDKGEFGVVRAGLNYKFSSY